MGGRGLRRAAAGAAGRCQLITERRRRDIALRAQLKLFLLNRSKIVRQGISMAGYWSGLMNSIARQTCALLIASLFFALSLPIAAAASVSQDIGTHTLSDFSCTSVNEEDNNPWYVIKDDEVEWRVNVTGSSSSSGRLYSWLNLTITLTASVQYVDDLSDTYDVVPYISGSPVDGLLSVTWDANTVDLYTIEWDSKMVFKPFFGSNFECSVSGGHSLVVSEN